MPTKIASLFAEIGVKTDQLNSGLAQAKKSLQGAQGSLKDLTGQIPGLQGALNLVSNPLVLAGAGIAALGAFTLKATKETVEYNKQVREMSTALGISADETSRIIQVSDDWGISIGEVRQSLGLMAKNGIDPTIDNLADLADEFVASGGGAEFAEKASKLLGRSWQTLIPILQKGGKSLRDQADAIDDNLIATEKSIKASREFEVAMDTLGDSVNGLKYSIGNGLIPVLTKLTDSVNESITTGEGFVGALLDGKISLGDYMKIGIETTFTQKDLADANEWLSKKLEEQVPVIKTQVSSIDESERAMRRNAVAAEELEVITSKVALAISEVTKAALGKQALDNLTASYQAGTISEDQYEQAARRIMIQMLNMPEASIDAQMAVRDLQEDLEDGKITSGQWADEALRIWNNLNKLDGMHVKSYIDVQVNQVGTFASGGLPTEDRQHGGMVYPGRRYTVGEAGPETLVMGQSGGYVIPHTNGSGGDRPINITINGDVSRDNIYTLARAVGAELNRQSRYN